MGKLGIFNQTSLPALRKMMDLSAWRQRACAANLANATTPGYRPREVKFADELKRAGSLSLEVTHPGHVGSTRDAPQVEVREELSADGPEGVDIEKEMVSLAENQLRFSLAARLTALRVQSLRNSIRGR